MGVRIGIDVGERSVGFAAVDYDDDGWPIEILAAVSHIHDGGMDPDTAKSPRSRLATAGVARRTRRLIRNRRRRLRKLDDALIAHGIPVPDEELAQTHEAWHARAALVEAYVNDDTERVELLSLALRHMARHRGWRNPWWSYRRLAEEPSPSKELTATFTKARDRFGVEIVGDPLTMGQLVSRVISTQSAIRPIKGALDGSVGPVMAEKVLQQDTLAEARMILALQGVSEQAANGICQALMFATEPTIPKERIGRCDLIPELPRATTATLEFQEYRIRDAVANLRIGDEARGLTDQEHDAAVDFLMNWREADSPRWREVAEVLDVGARQLKQPSIDQGGGSKAPTDRTSINLEAKASKKSELGVWWSEANSASRADLIDFMTDLSGANEDAENPSLAQFLKESGDSTFELMEKVKLDSGRASYSREALQRLLIVMRERRCNAHGARTEAFDLPANWSPTPPSFVDDIEHPTVSRVNALVYRFLQTATMKWGVPEAVVIEHVRGSFMGPTALAEFESEIRFNTSRREKVKTELASQGVVRPTNTDVRRFEAIQRQQGTCLYCGTSISMSGSELDHIVPKAGGGSSRIDNLVATCRSCNHSKNRLPFAVWAGKTSKPGVSIDDAVTRVRAWKDPRRNAKQLKRLQRDVQHRLTLTEDDEPIDERSLGSTAYAARQMSARTQSFLVQHGSSPDHVHVYAGAVTAQARNAGGFADIILLRDKRTKTRFDRRHHAIDATVLTSLRPSVAHTLLTRGRLRSDERTAFRRDDPERNDRETWREYRGTEPSDVRLFEEWKQRAGRLAELAKERIDADRVPVVRPLRLSPRVGSIHADTVERLAQKNIADAFSADEIRRVINTPLFEALTAEAAGESLETSSARAELLDWDPEKPVDLYPSNAAYLPVRGGAVAIGGSAKYARVYAWQEKKGFAFGMVRMFAGEFGRLGLLKPGIDLFTVDLPAWSQAMRNAPPALVQRIRSGEARQIGWLAINDEIELDPTYWAVGDGKIGEFMKAAPEQAWTLSGFFSESKLSIAPAVLASEGLDDSTPSAIADVLRANRIPTAVNILLRAPGTAIIRRTILGNPRWQDDGLPTSWKPQEAAARAFES